MSRKLLAATLLLWCPALAIAQEGEVSATETQQDPVAAYNDLVKALNQAVSEWRQDAMKRVAEAKKNNKPMPAISMAPPTKKFIGQASKEKLDEFETEDVVLADVEPRVAAWEQEFFPDREQHFGTRLENDLFQIARHSSGTRRSDRLL